MKTDSYANWFVLQLLKLGLRFHKLLYIDCHVDSVSIADVVMCTQQRKAWFECSTDTVGDKRRLTVQVSEWLCLAAGSLFISVRRLIARSHNVSKPLYWMYTIPYHLFTELTRTLPIAPTWRLSVLKHLEHSKANPYVIRIWCNTAYWITAEMRSD